MASRRTDGDRGAARPRPGAGVVPTDAGAGAALHRVGCDRTRAAGAGVHDARTADRPVRNARVHADGAGGMCRARARQWRSSARCWCCGDEPRWRCARPCGDAGRGDRLPVRRAVTGLAVGRWARESDSLSRCCPAWPPADVRATTPGWWRSTSSRFRWACCWWRGAAATSTSCACCSAPCWRSIGRRCCRSPTIASVILLVVAALYRPFAVGAFDPAIPACDAVRAARTERCSWSWWCWHWWPASRPSARCWRSDRCCCRPPRRAAGGWAWRRRWRWRSCSARLHRSPAC